MGLTVGVAALDSGALGVGQCLSGLTFILCLVVLSVDQTIQVLIADLATCIIHVCHAHCLMQLICPVQNLP